MTLFFVVVTRTDLFYFQPQIFFIPLSHYSSLMILQSEKARISQSNRNPGNLLMGCLLGKRLLKVACYHTEVRTLVVRLKELLFNLTVLQSRNAKTWPIVGW